MSSFEQGKGWIPSNQNITELLSNSVIDNLRLVHDSSNYVFLVDLLHSSTELGLGVYKPAKGERPLHDFPIDSLYLREVATFEISRLLGWNLIPPTVICDGPHGIGSLQLFIPHDPAHHYFELRKNSDYEDQLSLIAAFDLIVNNADRKGGHVLLGDGNQLWCIDNGLCFNQYYKLRTVIWDYAGKRLSEKYCEDLHRILQYFESHQGQQEFLRFICIEEISALINRIKFFLENPILPTISSNRSVPWPLI